MHVDRDSAAVILDSDRVVGVNGDLDAIRLAGERFVDGVIDDLVHHVMQSAEVIGIADVHPRTLAYGVESFQDFDVFCCVVFCHLFAF